MAKRTKIEWCDATFNPWVGCTKISPACENCYAERDFGHRRHFAEWGPGKPRRKTSEAYWKKPLRWNRKAEHEGTRLKVFCGSLCDIGDLEAPAEWFDETMNLVTNTPNLTWLFLSKRPETLKERLASFGKRYLPNTLPGCDAAKGLMPWPLPNLWIGVTTENQKMADKRIPILLNTPAIGRFVSIEPILGEIDFNQWMIDDRHYMARCPRCDWIGSSRHCGSGDYWPQDGCECPECGYECDNLPGDRKIDWVILGGETGPNARPLNPHWVRTIRDQCQRCEVPFFFKQWGEFEYQLRQGVCAGMTYHDIQYYEPIFVGKQKAGCLLDGREHKEFPEGLK